MIQSVKILFQVTNEITAQKIKTADLVAFTEKIFNEILHFLCSGSSLTLHSKPKSVFRTLVSMSF